MPSVRPAARVACRYRPRGVPGLRVRGVRRTRGGGPGPDHARRRHRARRGAQPRRDDPARERRPRRRGRRPRARRVRPAAAHRRARPRAHRSDQLHPVGGARRRPRAADHGDTRRRVDFAAVLERRLAAGGHQHRARHVQQPSRAADAVVPDVGERRLPPAAAARAPGRPDQARHAARGRRPVPRGSCPGANHQRHGLCRRARLLDAGVRRARRGGAAPLGGPRSAPARGHAGAHRERDVA